MAMSAISVLMGLPTLFVYILSQTYNATSVYFYCYTQEQYQINFSSTELDCRTIDTSRKIFFVTFCVMRLEKLINFQR